MRAVSDKRLRSIPGTAIAPSYLRYRIAPWRVATTAEFGSSIYRRNHGDARKPTTASPETSAALKVARLPFQRTREYVAGNPISSAIMTTAEAARGPSRRRSGKHGQWMRPFGWNAASRLRGRTRRASDV